MKKLSFWILVFVLMVAILVPSVVLAKTSDKTLTTLENFITRYNDIMDELEYQTIYGYDAKILENNLMIKSGEINDTVQFFLPDYQGGFIQLNFEKGTNNIKEIWSFILTRGPSKAPERLLEIFSGLANGAGALKEYDDIIEVMYKLGLYDQNAFTEDKQSSLISNGVKVGYSIMEIQDDLYLFAYATPE